MRVRRARCPVPDERYEYLCDIWKPAARYPAHLSVTDIAGLIKGASEGQGLGNAFLSHIQAVDGIFHVVRAFDSDDVVHVDDSVDPVRDLATINYELCRKDLEIVEKGVIAEATALRKRQGKPDIPFGDLHPKMTALLEKSIPIRDGKWSSGEIEIINEKFPLITTKPMIYLVNLSQADYIRKKNKWLMKIHTWIQANGGGTMIPISVEFEQSYWDKRGDPAAAKAFLEENKVTSALPKIITQGFGQLGLIYYFTAGEKEVRCWNIRDGTLAPQAAGVIHGDFERGFIKAEVVAYGDFKSLCGGKKGMVEVKAAGKYRQEGRTYVVQDGGTLFPNRTCFCVVTDEYADILHFQFNVTAAPKKK